VKTKDAIALMIATLMLLYVPFTVERRRGRHGERVDGGGDRQACG